ncbi:hypothetical protein [Ensifer adhaerens]|uniref:hypothetical protein n=1 Tax=Ensifer adhaerens TaxID=106592 RepID=UPI0030B88652
METCLHRLDQRASSLKDISGKIVALGQDLRGCLSMMKSSKDHWPATHLNTWKSLAIKFLSPPLRLRGRPRLSRCARLIWRKKWLWQNAG